MNGSTGGSRVALNPEKRRTRQAAGSKQWTPQRLRSAGSYWQARILATAAHLELFDWLGKRARGAKAATNHFGGTQEGWKTFLDALSAMGLLKKRIMSYENSSFTLRYLCSGKGSFLLSDYDAWDVWGRLPVFLTSGKRPKISQPFFTDREQTERLLQSLDQDAREDCALPDGAATIKPLENPPRCRRRSRELCYCVLPSVSSTSGDHRRTPPGG